MDNFERLQSCCGQIRKMTDFQPDVALILGSGLGAFADEIRPVATVDYKDLEGFPVSTVPGHKGRFVFGYVEDVKVVVMQGRVHYYEGYSMEEVLMPTRIMGMLGAKILFLTNASGGIAPTLSAGDFMLISDHIMSFFPNPLIGKNDDRLGTRFPDMSHVYNESLGEIIRKAAGRLEIPLKEGVYVQLTGPTFETPAEVRMLGILGGDAVGMSTACEAAAANHMGMQVCGISCIANKAAGLSKTPLTHAEVQETADRVAPLFKKLIWNSIADMKGVLTGGIDR